MATKKNGLRPGDDFGSFLESLCPGLTEILFRDFSLEVLALKFRPKSPAEGAGPIEDRVISGRLQFEFSAGNVKSLVSWLDQHGFQALRAK